MFTLDVANTAAWKVRGSAGQEGWFIEESSSIKFINNGK
jgi:hypothetical protein